MSDHELKKIQLENLKAILEAARDFSNEAGISFSEPVLDRQTVVLESGHQPNFLPHTGFLKKLFLLNFFRNKFHEKGKKAAALFGFADYDISTSELLTQNRLPAFNKRGYEKVGFRIPDDRIWIRFNNIEKPDERDWEKEMEKIRRHYKKYSISQDMELNLDVLMKELDESYAHATNFPDLNAFFISRICNRLLDLDIIFFRCSDLQKKGVFIKEWINIIHSIDEYNRIYNSEIKEHRLDLPQCSHNLLPFWYHCPCGAKVNLFMDKGYASGRCRLCSKDHLADLERPEEIFKDLSPNAVARNLIFSEGMGTHIFITGSGGSLKYGRISDRLSIEMGFNLPVTVSWKSRDYYKGPAHASAIGELGRICGVAEEDLGSKDIDKMIRDKKTRLAEMAARSYEQGDKGKGKKYERQHASLRTSIAVIKAVFDTTPSFLDIFVSHNATQVAGYWERALRDIGDEQIIIRDVIYNREDIVDIYRKVEEISD